MVQSLLHSHCKSTVWVRGCNYFIYLLSVYGNMPKHARSLPKIFCVSIAPWRRWQHDTKLANKGKIISTTEVVVYQYYIIGIQCMTGGKVGAYITSNNICAKGYYGMLILFRGTPHLLLSLFARRFSWVLQPKGNSRHKNHTVTANRYRKTKLLLQNLKYTIKLNDQIWRLVISTWNKHIHTFVCRLYQHFVVRSRKWLEV